MGNMRFFFLFFHKNTYCEYLLEVPQQGTSNEYPQYMFFYGELEKLILEITSNTSSLTSLLMFVILLLITLCIHLFIFSLHVKEATLFEKVSRNLFFIIILF